MELKKKEIKKLYIFSIQYQVVGANINLQTGIILLWVPLLIYKIFSRKTDVKSHPAGETKVTMYVEQRTPFVNGTLCCRCLDFLKNIKNNCSQLMKITQGNSMEIFVEFQAAIHNFKPLTKKVSFLGKKCQIMLKTK